jgi:malate dehydrogenase (oxaloacetate-decarboxylating)(NADP+)
VLGFPFIFRGALDVRASRINEAMKRAAVYALAELARRGEVVPQAVRAAYPNDCFDFGRDYILPKPFDPRILTFVAPAVAQAAMDSGVARRKVDTVEYTKHLEQTVGVLANL